MSNTVGTHTMGIQSFIFKHLKNASGGQHILNSYTTDNIQLFGNPQKDVKMYTRSSTAANTVPNSTSFKNIKYRNIP
jgi:hypothetical protein